MITHVVLFKLPEASKENVQRVCDLLSSLRGNVPTLLEIEVGVNAVLSDRSSDVALITRFNSLAEMEQYQVHTYHQGVLNQLKEFRATSTSVDYVTA